MEIWSKLRHPNILPLRQHIIDDEGYLALISDWMVNGTIIDYIKEDLNINLFPLVSALDLYGVR